MSKIKCPHEDNIEYGKLEMLDGEPIFNVYCKTCGATGIIHLVEAGEEWTEKIKCNECGKPAVK